MTSKYQFRDNSKIPVLIEGLQLGSSEPILKLVLTYFKDNPIATDEEIEKYVAEKRLKYHRGVRNYERCVQNNLRKLEKAKLIDKI